MPFRVALSGLNASQADLAVTGNNIANANTTGFKKSRTEFVDVYAVAYQGISNTTPGSGVRLAAINQQFTQGNVNYTDNNLDLTVNGQGFFVVSDNNGTALTRAGEFHVNSNGYVINNQNQRLQVFPPANATSSLFNTGVLADLQLTNTIGAPTQTTLVDANINFNASEIYIPLNPGAAATDLTNPPFNPTDPNTFHYSTSTQVYDSFGVAHAATMYFTMVNNGANGFPRTWQARTIVDGTYELTPAGQVAGTPAVLSFDNQGSLSGVTPNVGIATPLRLDYEPLNGLTALAGAQDLTIDIDLTGSSQYGAPFVVNEMIQDGYTTGRLSSIDIEDTGVVFARFTNGESRVLGKVALANVPNPNGLRLLGDTQWAETYESGTVVYGEALTGNFGSIQAGALEASNVDIAEQLVRLIESQRNFQANAQVITTADTVTQTIINIR